MKTSLLALCATLLLLSASGRAETWVLDTGNRGYNCHGFTFTQGGEVVDQDDIRIDEDSQEPTDQVGRVIRDHYTEVSPEDARMGDIIVYDDPARPSHTGLVVLNDGGTVVVVSKDGQEGDLNLHEPGDYGHAGPQDWKIFRSNRQLEIPDSMAELKEQLKLAYRHRNRDLITRWAGRLGRLLSALHNHQSDLHEPAEEEEVVRGTSYHLGERERHSFMNRMSQPSYAQGTHHGCR